MTLPLGYELDDHLLAANEVGCLADARPGVLRDAARDFSSSSTVVVTAVVQSFPSTPRAACHDTEETKEKMLDTTSPLWWLLAAFSVVPYLAAMLPGMITTRQKIFVSCGPAVVFAGALAYATVNQRPLTEMLPVYCGINLAIATGMIGHRKAMRAYMAERADNPDLPEDGTATPWILQMAFTLPVFLGAAFWYMGAY
ncbi:hypothetical protein [Streptomyces sp. DH12]|uniref:hypothetical protein n=1 Tax=Streptomyces sp. DH12 TaxID=2857010 RepID=UPI001E60A0FE|nr:hypothetical protein [Streptomyces sp. DH12]